jgi:hypothetical protein
MRIWGTRRVRRLLVASRSGRWQFGQGMLRGVLSKVFLFNELAPSTRMLLGR